MQYNKQQFNKVNDKKIMKKVKKQWVVVSVASLAVLGGFAVSGTLNMNQPSVIAHADENNNMQGQSADTNKTVNGNGQGQSADTNKTVNGNGQGQSADTNKTVNGNGQGQSADTNKTVNGNGQGQSADTNKTVNGNGQGQSADTNKTVNGNGQGQSADTNKTVNGNGQGQSADTNKTVNGNGQGQSADANNKANGNGQGVQPATKPSKEESGMSLLDSLIATPQTSSDSSKETPQENFDSKSGAVAAWNAIHSDSQRHVDNTTSGNNDKSGDKQLQSNVNDPYYQASYQGVVSAWNKYNSLNNGNGTQPSKDYSNDDKVKDPNNNSGVDPNNPGSVDPNLNSVGKYSTDTNDKAQIPKDPNATNNGQNETQDVSGSVNIKENSSATTPKNASDGLATSGSTNPVSNNSVNNYNNQIKLNDYQVDLNDPSLQKAYNQGITKFLEYQGAYDAETGRWSGKNKNDAIDLDPHSDNAYDQAYRGAQDAISQQFTSDNKFSYDIQNNAQFNPNVSISNASSNYMSGFNDVINKVNNEHTAFVSNALQINNSLATSEQTNDPTSLGHAGRNIYYYGQIQNIKYMNDISFQNTSLATNYSVEQYQYLVPQQYSANLNFDGQNHITDMGGLTYSLKLANTSSSPQTNLQVQNFHTIYGSSFWGSMKLESYGNVQYNNDTYIGSQFINATSANVQINGNLNVFSVGSYNSPWLSNVPAQDNSGKSYDGKNNIYGDRQQNMEINNLTMSNGSSYYGSSTGGNIIELYGNIDMQSGSHMTLAPMNNYDNSAENNPNSNAVGIYLRKSGANLNINKDASVIINPRTNNPYKGLAQGIYNYGNINVNGGTLIINENGPLTNYSSDANYNSGTITVTDDGSFNINGSNMGGSEHSTNYLLDAASTVNVRDRGNFGIHTDGSGNSNSTLYLLYNSGNFNVDNPGQRVYLQIDNKNGSSGIGNLFYQQINAYSVRYSLGYKDATNNTPNAPIGAYYELQAPSGSGTTLMVYDTQKRAMVPINNATAYGAKYLSFDATPNAYFDGNMSLQPQSDGNKTLSGNIKLTNLPSSEIVSSKLNGGNNGYLNFTIHYDGPNDSNGYPVTDGSTQLNGAYIKSAYLVHSDGTKTPVKYYNNIYDNDLSKTTTNIVSVPQDAINGNDIEFTYAMPNGSPKSNVMVDVNYFYTGQQQSLYSNGTAIRTISTNPAYNNNSNAGYSPNVDTAKVTQPTFTPSQDTSASDGERDGIADASSSVGKHPENTTAYKKYYASDQPGASYQKSYKDAYNNSYNGYTDGSNDLNNDLNKNINSSYNVDNADKKGDQYSSGYRQANTDLQNGFSNNVSGHGSDSPNSGASMYKEGEDYATGVQNTVNGTTTSNSGNVQKGRNSFNSGYNDVLNPPTPNQSTSNQPNNPAYNYGVQMAKGMQDAENNKDIKPNDPNDPNGVNNQAYQNGQDAYNGRNDALNGSNRQDSKSNVYNNNYDATSAGLAKYSNTYSGNAPQNDSYNIGAATRNGISDYQKNGSNPTDNNTYNGTSKDQTDAAYRNAQNDFAEGKSHPNDTSSGHDVAYQAGQAAQNGLNDAANGNNNQSSKYGNDTIPSNTYQTAQEAYQAGLTGNPNSDSDVAKADKPSYQAGVAAKQAMADAFSGKTSNSSGNDTYKAAYNAAKDGMNGQPASTSDQSQMNAYNNGKAIQAAMQAASQDSDKTKAYQTENPSQINKSSSYYNNVKSALGFYPDTSNLNDQQKSQLKNYNEAYNAYQYGSNKDNHVYNNDADLNSATSNPQFYAYTAGKNADAINYGIEDARKGVAPETDGNPSNPSYKGDNKDAYDNAYKAYRSGFDQQSNQDAVNDNQGYAYNLGKAAQAGVQSVTSTGGSGKNNQGVSPTTNYPGNSPESNEYSKAATAAGHGDNNKTASATPGDDQTYGLSYQAGQTLQATRDGIADAAGNANGGKQNTNYDGTSDSNSKQNTAYSKAYAAYNAGYNGTPSVNYNNYDSGQADAYNQGRAAQAAVQDAKANKYNSNPNNSTNGSIADSNSNYNNSSYKPSGSDWTAAQTNVYKQAYQAYLDGKSKPTTDASATPDTTQNQAYKAGQSDGIIPTAIMDAINGKNNSGNYSQSYKDAQTNFNNDLNGSSSGDQESNAAIAVKQAMNDASKNIGNADSPSSTYNYNNDQKAEYTAAYNAYKAGLTKSTNNSGSNKDVSLSDTPGNSIPYSAGLASYNGVNDIRTNDGNRNEPTNKVTKGYYNNAQTAYNDGLNGDTTSSNAQLNADANKAGDDDRKGISDAINGIDKTTGDKDANKAAQDGYNAFNSKPNSSIPTSSEVPADDNSRVNSYQAGWAAAKGLADIQKDGKDHSDQFSDQAQKAAYQQAQSNYNAGKADMNGDKTKNDAQGKQVLVNSNISGSTAYQAGQKDQAAQNGITDAINNVSNKDSDNKNYPKNNNNGQQDAYNAANNGYQDGVKASANAHLDKVPDDQQKDSSQYTAGYNAGQAARQGIVDAESNSTTNYTNANEQTAYQQAKNDYNDGMNNPAATSNETPNKSAAYQQGQEDRQGINDALLGNPKTNGNGDSFNATKAGLDPKSNPSDYKSQQAAYNIGVATRKAITDSNNGDFASDGNSKIDDHDSLEVNTYNQAKQDYNDGLNGNTSNVNTDSAAYKAGQAARTGYKDAEKTQNNVSKQGNQFNKTAYTNAQSAFNAGLKGDSTGSNARLNSTANKAGLDSRQGIDDAIANKEPDSKKYNNKDGDKDNLDYNPDYQAAYDAAKAGNALDNKGKPSDQVSPNEADQNTAYQAGQAAQQGIADVQTGANNSGNYSNNPAAARTYNEAKQAYNDGLNGNNSDQASKDNPTANEAGQAARQAIVDAQSGNSNNAGQYTTDPAKSAYENAHQAFINGKNGNPDPNNPVANAAGKAASQGAADAQIGANNANQYSSNPNAQKAYNNAQKAYNDGLNDKNNGNDPISNGIGKAAHQGIKDAKTGEDNSKMYPNYPDKTAYNNAKDAYNAGINGDTSSAAAKKNIAANQAGFNNYVPISQPSSDNNVPTNNVYDQNTGAKAGQKAFIGGTPLNIHNIDLSGKSQAFKNAFTKAYNQSQDGFKAGMNGIGKESSDPAYQAGYKASKDYQKGVKDATRGKKPANNSDGAYKVGYDAYKAGMSGKKADKQTIDKLSPAYRKAYENDYKAGRKQYVAVTNQADKAARKNAVGNNNIPRNLKHESQAYKDAYMKAFNEEVKRNLPSYVYNLKKIYSHDAPALTRKTRVNKYAKTPRYARHAFKVLGYKITSSGQVVYRVKGLGWISANDKSVDNLYYRRHDTKKPIQKVRVIKPSGTYIYDSKTFNYKTAVRRVRKGETIKVERIERLGGITRFYIGDGKYISSNKTIVEHLR
ncbi:DUF5776 domain-containing protein [Apilactobacillus timberlakei]|uniref:DUF5776 domain-containing protein n=1 Tax=Apilactobacillus timberlakei TaxID=2008380 RepID=UPI00112A8939|nr:DUF5776 domain-containing protein [Apilactobacillus timberlakei]TPR19082.1 hypothetical protein DYZ95_00255 [Apilactobacillus timberlakei]